MGIPDSRDGLQTQLSALLNSDTPVSPASFFIRFEIATQYRIQKVIC